MSKNDSLDLKIEKDDGYSQQKIRCPVCGFDYVSIEREVEIVEGNDNYEARPGHVRGGVMLIKGCCEEGHRFNIVLGFHKGHTFAWSERLPDLEQDEDGFINCPKEMR